jgi:hypothetical protein
MESAISEPPIGKDFWNWLYANDAKLPHDLRITSDEPPTDEEEPDSDEINAHCRELKRMCGFEPPQEYGEFLAHTRVIGGSLGRRLPVDEVSPPDNITDVFTGIWKLQFEFVEFPPESVNPLIPIFELEESGLYCMYLGEPAADGHFPVVEVYHGAGCRFGVEGSSITRFLAANLVRKVLENSSQEISPVDIARRVAQTDPCSSNYYRLYLALRDTGDAAGAETALNAARTSDVPLGHKAACEVEPWFLYRRRTVNA